MVFVVGLTGGIASGKSTVARRLAEHGAIHIDADVLAREAVEPGTPGLRRIIERFGASVLREDGLLDRPALARLVFADDEARTDLNAITHPVVRALFRQRVDDAARENPSAVIVYDVPLLVEAGDGGKGYDLVIVVHAERDARIRRLVELRGLSVREAAERVDAQSSDEERLSVADIVIDSGGTLEETLRQTDELWPQLRRRADAGGGAQ